MDRYVEGFIRSSLVWLGVGVLLGLAMTAWPGETLVYRPAHFHANLLGFVSMMIYGVAYHVIPRFSGNPLYSQRLPLAHLWLANGGLALMVAAWMLRVAAPAVSSYMLPIGGTLSSVGTGMFIYTLWRTIGGHSRPAGAQPLPVFRVPAGAAGGR